MYRNITHKYGLFSDRAKCSSRQFLIESFVGTLSNSCFREGSVLWDVCLTRFYCVSSLRYQHQTCIIKQYLVLLRIYIVTQSQYIKIYEHSVVNFPPSAYIIWMYWFARILILYDRNTTRQYSLILIRLRRIPISSTTTEHWEDTWMNLLLWC